MGRVNAGFLILFSILLIYGCSTAEETMVVYKELSGTISGINYDAEKLLILEKTDNGEVATYDIPLENVLKPGNNLKLYEVGQEVTVTVYSEEESEEDDWNLEHLRFEITVAE